MIICLWFAIDVPSYWFFLNLVISIHFRISLGVRTGGGTKLSLFAIIQSVNIK